MSDAVTHRGRAKTRRVGRRRVILAVVCLVVGVLVSAAGVVSGWRCFGYKGKHIWVVCGPGAVWILVAETELHLDEGWFLDRPSGDFRWNGSFEDSRVSSALSHDWIVIGFSSPSARMGDRWFFLLSIWFLAAVFLLTSTGLAFSARRSRRRIHAGLCPTCHYDLRGLPASAPCPECGKVRVASAVGVASDDEGNCGA